MSDVLTEDESPAPVPPRRESQGEVEPTPDHAEEDLADVVDDAVPLRGYSMLPMVGLGGSAGSIEALQSFFSAAPADTGIAFVVVLHLSMDRESMLSQILQRCTSMPVAQVADSVKVEANHVYVIPPGKTISSANGHLVCSDLTPERGRRIAVDLFFRTLADTHGPRAAAIVLSGADGDGAIGIKRIKERGGLTIAQDPNQAEYPSMPKAAIATGTVDWVLPVAEMPARLMTYQRLLGRLALPREDGPQPARAPIPADDASETALRELLAFVRIQTGRDFSYYKRATILRRIGRRMSVNGIEGLPAYLDFVRTHLGESGALLQDMLISVTNFFRDRHAFDALAAQIPDLFEGKSSGDELRVWVPACATGEEAYTIAMLLAEHARGMSSPPSIQLFATDLDEDAIRTGREGVYPAAIVADVSEDRLRRFFLKDHRGYRVRGEIRETVLFAQHDLLKDAPFSRIDLFSCRNLLIYLDRDAQQRALEIAQFALRPSGRLFLGISETVDGSDHLFEAVDKKHRIYRPHAASSRRLPPLLATSIATASFELQSLESGRVSAATGSHSRLAAIFPDGRPPTRSWRELHLRLIERLAPPSIVVTSDYQMVHLSDSVGRFLRFRGGEPAAGLLSAVDPSLALELRTALRRVQAGESLVQTMPVAYPPDGDAAAVVMSVASAADIAPGYLLVTFSMRQAVGQLPVPTSSDPTVDTEVRRLERSVDELQWHLRDVTEQGNVATQELKASNEELQAMNEELRSATEELETSREELQSINEELTTVNLELKHKVDELARSNGDLQNLMNSTAIATIFLDRDLRITFFTPAAVQLFNLLETDVGRPLSDLTGRLDYPDLLADAADVLARLAPVEREVRFGTQWQMSRILPYRSADDRIAGVVLTFLDISQRVAAQRRLLASQEHLRLVLENAREYAIVSMDLERRIISWNMGAERLVGYAETEIRGRLADVIFVPEDREAGAPEREARLAVLDGRAADERWHLRKDGSRFWGSGVMMAMRDGSGEAPIGLLKIFRDHTEVRAAEQALERSRTELVQALGDARAARAEAEMASHAKDRFFAILSHELRTPLTPVVMALDALDRSPELSEESRLMLDLASRNVDEELRLIDDLLDVTRIAAGKVEISRQQIDMHQVIAAAVEVCRADFDAKQQKLDVRLEADRHAVSGDPSRLQQVIWNILKNASKFTPEGGVVSLRTRGTGSRFLVEVIDNGIGIDTAALPLIFEAFVQEGDWVTSEFGGLGLGLAIAKSTVEAHGGDLRASSPGRGQGATFTIDLPLS